MPITPLKPQAARVVSPVAGGSGVLQRPAIQWGGGVQHNGNNPEVVDTVGRSYSSRAFDPAGIPFGPTGGQQVFSSNKNMTGKPLDSSLVLSNPGSRPLRLEVQLEVDQPRAASGVSSREVVVAPHASLAVPVARQVPDGGFTAFRATVLPADAASRQARLSVDVVSHQGDATADVLAHLPLMKTEGERGYRVPPSRLGENKAFVEETRWVMRAAGVTPDPITDQAAWPAAAVRKWAGAQQALGTQGVPTAFDPQVNKRIQGRVNGLVAATEGRAVATPVSLVRTGTSACVRLLPNKEPPALLRVGGAAAGRPGASSRDVGAYGKGLTVEVPLLNRGTTPVTYSVSLQPPPVGQDGAQLPGHQVYNGPVRVEVDGRKPWGAPASVRVDQPTSGGPTSGAARLITVEVPPGKTVSLRLGLQVHANSQFPLDVVVTRTR